MLAYLDAGSGSIIASAVAGGVAGAAVAAKMGWHRVTGRFKRGQEQEQAEEQEAPEVVAEDPTAG